jgi:hypothetical protein
MATNNKSLIQLGYISKPIGLMDDQKLADILEKSRKNNSENEITGILLYSEGSFLQVLEGEPARIHETFFRIKADPRHQSINVLFEEPISDRHFKNWSMDFHHLHAGEIAKVPGMRHFLNQSRLLSDFLIAQGHPATLLKSMLMHFAKAA